MAIRLPPIGFWSYARQDDEVSQGKLSSLRTLLMSELQQRYGRDPVKIWQDVSSIPPGDEWEQQIRSNIETSSFLIPIITPSFLQSPWCNQELLIFREREREIRARYPGLGSRRLIFPIHYVETVGIEPCDPAVLDVLRPIQSVKFQDLRLEDYSQKPVRAELSRLAASICTLLLMFLEEAPVSRTAAPPPSGPAQPRPKPPDASETETAPVAAPKSRGAAAHAAKPALAQAEAVSAGTAEDGAGKAATGKRQTATAGGDGGIWKVVAPLGLAAALYWYNHHHHTGLESGNTAPLPSSNSTAWLGQGLNSTPSGSASLGGGATLSGGGSASAPAAGPSGASDQPVSGGLFSPPEGGSSSGGNAEASPNPPSQ
jgi:hypothetical protein